MSTFSSFPPQMQGPGLGDDAVTQQFLADLLAGSKKKEYKNIGAALIGTLFNVVGAGAEALGVKGAGSIGTDIFGVTNPSSQRDLAYLLVQLMGQKQAEKEMNKRFDLEQQRMKETAATQEKLFAHQARLQELESKLKEGMQKTQITAEGQQLDKKLEATSKEAAAGREFEAAQAESKNKTAQAMQNRELLVKQQMGREENATQKEVAKIGAEGRAATAAQKESPQITAARRVANALGMDMAAQWKKDIASGAGILQQIPDLIGDPSYAELRAAGVPTDDAVKQAGYLKSENGKLSGKIPELVRESIQQQAPGNALTTEQVFGDQLEQAKGRVMGAIDLLNRNPAIAGSEDMQIDMRGVAKEYNSNAADLARIMADVYRGEKEKYDETLGYSNAFNQLATSLRDSINAAQGFEQTPNGGARLVARPGARRDMAQQAGPALSSLSALIQKHSITNLFDQGKAKDSYEAFSAAIQKDPMLNAFLTK